MSDHLIESVEVKTFLQRLRCPNPSCDGILEHDGKERAKDGVHGGVPEYRHKCDDCGAGFWVKDKYPRVKYELAAQAPIAPHLEIKKPKSSTELEVST